MLGLIPTTRLPEQDHRPEAEIRDRLWSVLLDERQPDEDDAILAGFVGTLDFVGVVVDDQTRTKEAKKRAKELAKGSELGVAVGESVRAAQAVVMAAVVASTVASIVSAGG